MDLLHVHLLVAPGEQRTPAAARCAALHLCAASFICFEFSGDMRGCRSCLVGEEGPLGMGIPVSAAA